MNEIGIEKKLLTACEIALPALKHLVDMGHKSFNEQQVYFVEQAIKEAKNK